MQALLDQLGRELHDAQLEFITPTGARWTLGHGYPRACVEVDSVAVLGRILLNPRYELAAEFTRGHWRPTDGELLRVLKVATRIQGQWDAKGGTTATWRRALGWLGELNTIIGSRHNVHAHYDRDASFYGSFLDADWHYSCAYFEDDTKSLDEAQQAKCQLIARKLNLRPGARVLDIGCGFGSLAMYLAEHHGAKVTGVTLSESQLGEARQRVARRGRDDDVELRLQAYRKTCGEFDAVVRVGMFEHVGRPQYDRYFRAVHERLRPGGTALIHTIGRSSPAGATNTWIRRHIFPGGYIPAASEVLAPIEHSHLVLTDLEIWRRHYALTLAAWHRGFDAQRDRWRARYGEAFCRMWTFYLLASQAAFEWGDLVVFQFQLARMPVALPRTRNYLYRQPPSNRVTIGSVSGKVQPIRAMTSTAKAKQPTDHPEQGSGN